MVKGLIAQFINKVRKTGFGVFADFKTCEKSIFTMIGYIMKNKQTAKEFLLGKKISSGSILN
jgi:hypothetical protein